MSARSRSRLQKRSGRRCRPNSGPRLAFAVVVIGSFSCCRGGRCIAVPAADLGKRSENHAACSRDLARENTDLGSHYALESSASMFKCPREQPRNDVTSTFVSSSGAEEPGRRRPQPGARNVHPQ